MTLTDQWPELVGLILTVLAGIAIHKYIIEAQPFSEVLNE
jgi:hypothetical protein